MKSAIHIILLFIVSSLAAQNAKQDIYRINEAYSKLSAYKVETVYNLYQSGQAKNIFKTELGSFAKSNNLQLSKIAKLEMLTSFKYYIVADNEQKEISISAVTPHAAADMFPIPLDTLFKVLKSVEFFKPATGVYAYRFMVPDYQYEEIEVWFNPKTYYVEKLVLYSKEYTKLNEHERYSKSEKQRLEIVFKNMVVSPAFAANTFSERNYIDINNGKIICNASHKDYRLINTMQTSKN